MSLLATDMRAQLQVGSSTPNPAISFNSNEDWVIDVNDGEEILCARPCLNLFFPPFFVVICAIIYANARGGTWSRRASIVHSAKNLCILNAQKKKKKKKKKKGEGGVSSCRGGRAGRRTFFTLPTNTSYSTHKKKKKKKKKKKCVS
jgi:hypothetical protein